MLFLPGIQPQSVSLPAAGEEPWDTKLNAAINGIDTRVTTLESSGGASEGAWFANRRWYALGTSLTYQNFYTGPLASLSGMLLTNVGQNSGTLSTGPGGNGYIWTQMTTNVGTDAEIITMETTNDWRLSVPLGSTADGENHATSFYGALQEACAWILSNRPAARFFMLTNYTDALAPGTYPNFKTQNSQGKWYWEYNDAVRRVCDIYGVALIEVARDSGLNYYTASYYTSDGLHLNTLGGTRYAEFVWSRMRSLGWLTSRPTSPGAGTNVPVTGVTISQGSAISIAPGQNQQFSAVIAPPNATNKGVTWASSNTAAVTIDGLGLAHGVANGTSNITCTTVDGGFVATCVVTVATASVTSVDVTPATTSVGVGGTTQLTATVLPSNAGNKTVTWQSSDATRATVNSSGLVTGVALGTATITATTQQGGFTDTCVVTVAASEWSLSPQTTFRQWGLTGLSATGSNPTYVTAPGGSGGAWCAIFISSVGDNAIEFAVGNGSLGCGMVLGSSTGLSGDFIELGGASAPLVDLNTKGSLSQGGFFNMGAPTPAATSPAGWGNNVIYRVGRVGTRVKIVRVDVGNTLVTIWDGDLDVNWGGAHIPRYAEIDLGVTAYGPPGSAHTLPVNCKTGTWTPP